MNDLLNEEEFLPKEHNPKRWFNIFYALSLAISTVCFWGARLFINYLSDIVGQVIVITGVFMPLLLSLLMIFLKKDNILYLKAKKAASAIAILTLLGFCCFISLMIGATIQDHKNMDDIPLFFGVISLVYLGIYLVSIAIILPILKRAQRINKLPQ